VLLFATVTTPATTKLRDQRVLLAAALAVLFPACSFQTQ
jgi:hypothetical protein